MRICSGMAHRGSDVQHRAFQNAKELHGEILRPTKFVTGIIFTTVGIHFFYTEARNECADNDLNGQTGV